jgi:hypothetical protein
MAEGRRPKRFKRDIDRLAAGVTVRLDEKLADIYFLDQHPGWSWRDLQDAPDEVIETMQMLANARARASKRPPLDPGSRRRRR